MPQYKYLIIGGGMTAAAAIEGIRSKDKEGKIGLLAAERHPPYKRPPLSKGLWKGEQQDTIWMSGIEGNATLHRGRTATRIRAREKQVVDGEGEIYGYEKLLIATGGRVRTLPFDVDGVVYFRTLDDYNTLRQRCEKGKKTVVIGGGFIGSEIAAALSLSGQQVAMAFPEEGIGGRVFPDRLATYLNAYYTSKGVAIHNKVTVSGIENEGEGYLVGLSDGTELACDTVVAGLGIQPNIELAQAAGLEVNNGIEVDDKLRTSVQDILAAGDVASFEDAALARRVRVEHEDNALTMGAMAGRNMAGGDESYIHLPFFYSDLFDLGYEAVGELDNKSETVEDWKEEFKEGVIYYLKNQQVRGVLLWNTWEQVDHARELIRGTGPHSAGSLKGQLPK